MGRGLGVGGALGTVGILQTCVRRAKNLPVVLKMIPNETLKSSCQKDEFKETCEINLSSLLNVSIGADVQTRGKTPHF